MAQPQANPIEFLTTAFRPLSSPELILPRPFPIHHASHLIQVFHKVPPSAQGTVQAQSAELAHLFQPHA